MTDAQLLQAWDELGERLKWCYPIEEAFRRYRLLADGEEMDLLRWNSLGKIVHAPSTNPPEAA